LLGTNLRHEGVRYIQGGLSQADVEQYVAAHPEQKETVYNEPSILLRDGVRLPAVPYYMTFAEYLKPAAEDLRDAAR
jgi:hypothetical protein